MSAPKAVYVVMAPRKPDGTIARDGCWEVINLAASTLTMGELVDRREEAEAMRDRLNCAHDHDAETAEALGKIWAERGHADRDGVIGATLAGMLANSSDNRRTIVLAAFLAAVETHHGRQPEGAR